MNAEHPNNSVKRDAGDLERVIWVVGKVGRMYKLLDRRKGKVLLKWGQNLALNLINSDGPLKLSDKGALILLQKQKLSILTVNCQS